MNLLGPRGKDDNQQKPEQLPLPQFGTAPIFRLNLGKHKVSEIAYWGEQNLLILQDQTELVVVNNQGVISEDFKKQSKIDLHIEDLPNNKTAVSIADYVYSSSQVDLKTKPAYKNTYFHPGLASPETHDCIDLKAWLKTMAPTSKWKLSVTPDGKFIILIHPATKYFIAFQTITDQGQVLLPRNWMRFDTSKIVELPNDLEKAVVKLQESSAADIFESKPLTDTKKFSSSSSEFTIYDAHANRLFSDHIDDVGDNVCVDPRDPDFIYYCSKRNAQEMVRLKMKGDPKDWKPEPARFTQPMSGIHKLEMDPGGGFFLITMLNNQKHLVHSETMEPVGHFGGWTHITFEPNGNLRAIDDKNHLGCWQTNLGQIHQAVQARQAAEKFKALAQGYVAQALPAVPNAAAAAAPAPQKNYTYLEGPRQALKAQLWPQIGQANLQQLEQIRATLEQIKSQLRSQNAAPDEVDFFVGEVEQYVAQREKLLAYDEAKVIYESVRAKLPGLTDIVTAIELRRDTAKLGPLMSSLDAANRKQVVDLIAEVRRDADRIFRDKAQEITAAVQGLIKKTRYDLEHFSSKADFSDWVHDDLPELKKKLAGLVHECPDELHDVYLEIQKAREQLNELKDEYHEKFEKEHRNIQQKALGKNDQMYRMLDAEVTGLVQHLRDKTFTNRGQAELYMHNSPGHKQVIQEIDDFALKDPHRAAELKKKLRVQLGNACYDIERGSNNRINSAGEHMIAFGKEAFPEWRGVIKERPAARVELTWIPDEKTQGPGVTPEDVYGEVGLQLTDGYGKTSTVRLHQGDQREADWRYGNYTYRGTPVIGTRMKQSDYRTFSKGPNGVNQLHRLWLKGEIQEQLQNMRTELHAKKGDPAAYQTALAAYGRYHADNHVTVFRAMDKALDRLNAQNGKDTIGEVPKFSNHWVKDEHTESYLERMARKLNMQVELQEGCLLLKGHAGTGKDVLLRMFCESTKRPYFNVDCTKWTNETDLSEDITLEAKNGATEAVKVPSSVLLAIQTPGAVLYFNEFNAMPEQAQIFLHALMDEKRSLSLKTQSGKTIKVLESVLIVASMNPNYRGTYEPQMATRDRMIPMQIHYPPLNVPRLPGDPNTNPRINPAEALRIARSVKSLTDYTEDPDMSRNEFVKMWDSYVNRMQNGARTLTKVQEKDMDIILALVQFGNKLRKEFMIRQSKKVGAQKALPVSLPVTGRVLRRAALEMSKIPDQVKITINAEEFARNQLTEYLLENIDIEEDQELIKTAMNGWTSSKRVV